jgi:hypothetical protein
MSSKSKYFLTQPTKTSHIFTLEDKDCNTHNLSQEIKDFQNQYRYVESKASCNISDIQGIIYGGLSSRFWIFRKHINSMDRKMTNNEKNFPFLPWECLTIQLSHRDVDLVIKDEIHMKMLLRFLCYRINTINGDTGSAIPLQRMLFKQKSAYYRRKNVKIDESELMEEVKHAVMIKTSQKYSMLRARQKISFIAFQKRMTVQELLVSSIKKTFDYLLKIECLQIAKIPLALITYFNKVL